MRKYLVLLLTAVTLSTPLFAQRVVEIGVLLDNRTPEVEPLITQIQAEIVAAVGQDAQLSFQETNVLVNDQQISLAKQNYQKLLDNNVDIILAFGVINGVVLQDQPSYPKPTILFGAVNRDLLQRDPNQNSTGINNFTYLLMSHSYKKDLETFKKLKSFKNLGVIVEADRTSHLPLKTFFDAQAKAMDFDYRFVPYRTVQDITSGLEGLDAVYLAGGFFLNKAEIEELATALGDQHIPSFTSTSVQDVESGLLATNQPKDNLVQFFRRIALDIESIVNGTNASELPINIDYEERLTVNFNTADKVKVPIRFSLVATTDFVGDIKNVLSTKTYDLVTVMQEVREQNLSLRSSNKDVELAGQDVKTAKSNYLPDLSVSGTGSYVDPNLAEVSNGQNPEISTSGAVTLSQTLYSPDASANINIQKSLLGAQQEDYLASELDAIYNASQVYFNTLILKANLEITASNLDVTRKNLAIAEQNFAAGQAGKSDVLRFRSQIAQNTQDLIEAVNQLELAFISLNQVLNNDLSLEIDVADAELNTGVFEGYDYKQLNEYLDNPELRVPFEEFLVEEAKRNAPELKSLQFSDDAISKSLWLNTKARYLPTVALQGQYNQTFTRNGAGSEFPEFFGETPLGYYNAGVNLSIPIFQRTQRVIGQQTATIQREQIAINNDNLNLNIERNVKESVLNITNQIANIQLSEVSEKAAEESLELTQNAYSKGAVNRIQLIDAQTDYQNAQLARATAVYSYLLNAIELERTIAYFFLLRTDAENEAFIERFNDYLNNRNKSN